MARKSNKTAHVLNLLSGHEEEQETSGSAETAEAEAAARPAARPEAPMQNISVIDTTEEDPLTALIHSKLSDGLEAQEAAKQGTEAGSPSGSGAPAKDEETAFVETAPEEDASPAPTPNEEAPVETAPTEDASSAPAPKEEAPVETAPVETTPAESALPAAAPEPDFVRLNIMERIVQDKIIYFMREFNVCTCDRCVSDAVALTLNGLAPKYAVVDRAAVAPLSDFYTNKFITEVTVEAMKACVVVKENPRH
mgnify:CR=1 FL=1